MTGPRIESSPSQRREEEGKAFNTVLDAVNEFHSKCGFLSDEFSHALTDDKCDPERPALSTQLKFQKNI